jgi:hypothetical protein
LDRKKKERNPFGKPRLKCKVLKWIKILYGIEWSGLNWLRIGKSGGLL